MIASALGHWEWGGYPPLISEGLCFSGGGDPHSKISQIQNEVGTENRHKSGPQGTPRAYTYGKYETRHEESDFEDPEARGHLFI